MSATGCERSLDTFESFGIAPDRSKTPALLMRIDRGRPLASTASAHFRTDPRLDRSRYCTTAAGAWPPAAWAASTFAATSLPAATLRHASITAMRRATDTAVARRYEEAAC